MLGVGAAFDVWTGNIKDAPAWMKKSGLQWAHRLIQEPRRLWRRYAVIVPSFLVLILLQALGLKKYRLGSLTPWRLKKNVCHTSLKQVSGRSINRQKG